MGFHVTIILILTLLRFTKLHYIDSENHTDGIIQ
jgi:hypothetical protein